MVQPMKAATGPQLSIGHSVLTFACQAAGSRIFSISSRRVVQLDRLAAVDLLDLLAGDRVQRLDAALVQDGYLADQLVGRARSPATWFSRPRARRQAAATAPASIRPAIILLIRFIFSLRRSSQPERIGTHSWRVDSVTGVHCLGTAGADPALSRVVSALWRPHARALACRRQ